MDTVADINLLRNASYTRLGELADAPFRTPSHHSFHPSLKQASNQAYTVGAYRAAVWILSSDIKPAAPPPPHQSCCHMIFMV
jgi:hypothetical protein